MTELRVQMDNAMLVRGMAERTRETNLAAVARLARHYHRSPDLLSPAQVQAYVVHMLREEHLAWSTCNIAVQAFRFLYHTTLGRPEPTFTIPGPKHRKTLPETLSPAEVRRLLESTSTRKQRAVVATTYAAGLRVSEVVRVQLRHLDAARMCLRVEQGKGGKDRDTLLSPRLLEELRAYWRQGPPPWAATRRAATSAARPGSPTTPVGTGTVPSARRWPRRGGLRRGRRSCCRSSTSTSSSPYRTR